MEKMKKIVLLSMVVGALFWGCDDKKVDLDAFSSGKETDKETQRANQDIDKKSYAGLEDVFQDTSVIKTNGKYLLIVFGKNNCSYCEKLKGDIKDSQEIRDFLKKHFSSYYINISYNKNHHFVLNDSKETKEVDVMTSTLSSDIYKVYSTPTIVIGDTNGKTILEIPGYIPLDKFSKTLQFALSNQWQKTNDKKERMHLLQKFLEDQ